MSKIFLILTSKIFLRTAGAKYMQGKTRQIIRHFATRFSAIAPGLDCWHELHSHPFRLSVNDRQRDFDQSKCGEYLAKPTRDCSFHTDLRPIVFGQYRTAHSQVRNYDNSVPSIRPAAETKIKIHRMTKKREMLSALEP